MNRLVRKSPPPVLVRIAHLGIVFGLLVAFAPRAEAQARSHRVRPGQSLQKVAREHRVSVQDLAAENRVSPDASLHVGQVLTIPQRGVVYVRAGQTLSHIAREHRCTVEALARENRMRVDDRLREGQPLRIPGLRPPPREAAAVTEVLPRDWGTPHRAGSVTMRARDGSVTVLRLRDEDNRVPFDELLALSRLMRRGEEDFPLVGGRAHPRLALLLAAISDHFGGREVTLVSGLREAGGSTRETSRHVSGRATDIRVAGVPIRAVWDYCRSLSDTGCGLYPRSGFVHVDVRDQAAQWVDWSGPGQRARLGNLRGPFGKRKKGLAKVGRSITRPEEVPSEVELSGAELASALASPRRP